MDLCGFGAGTGAVEGVAVPWGRQGQGRAECSMRFGWSNWWSAMQHGMQSASRRLPLPLSLCLLDCLARHREHHRAVAVPVPVPVVLVVFVVVLLRLNSNRLLMPTILTNVDVGQTSIDARGVQKQKPKQTTAATTIKGRQGLEIDMYVCLCMYS